MSWWQFIKLFVRDRQFLLFRFWAPSDPANVIWQAELCTKVHSDISVVSTHYTSSTRNVRNWALERFSRPHFDTLTAVRQFSISVHECRVVWGPRGDDSCTFHRHCCGATNSVYVAACHDKQGQTGSIPIIKSTRCTNFSNLFLE